MTMMMQELKVISEEQVRKMRLKGKPKCPFCNIPLTYVYEGSKGYTNQKCDKCRNSFLVNTDTLEVLMIERAI